MMALDNVTAYQYFFGEEDLQIWFKRRVLREMNLAKTPEFTGDIIFNL